MGYFRMKFHATKKKVFWGRILVDNRERASRRKFETAGDAEKYGRRWSERYQRIYSAMEA